MQEKFTPIENERLFTFSPGKKMSIAHPKTQTLLFLKQFAYVYHAERDLPLPLVAMILN